MLSAIQRTSTPAFTPLAAAPAPVAAPAAPAQLAPVDRVQRSAAVGQIPASLNLFAASSPELSQALSKLASSPTEANSRDAHARFRVAIRKLDLSALSALQDSLKAEIAGNSSYRAQKLLDELRVDVAMEIFTKGGKPETPALTMPPVPGNTPESVVSGSLKQLNSHLSEANFKTAQAGFRVALRSLSPEQLLQTRSLVHAAIQTQSGYRDQLFLDKLLADIAMEQASRGIKPEYPALTMPPALGKTPAEIASNGLKLLQAAPSESQFKTALAAARVASRDLSADDKAALKQQLQALMQQTSDYRTQVYLDKVSRELF